MLISNEHILEGFHFSEYRGSKGTNRMDLNIIGARVFHRRPDKLLTDALTGKLFTYFRMIDDHPVRALHVVNHCRKALSFRFHVEKAFPVVMCVLYFHG